MSIIFDGTKEAHKQEVQLANAVDQLQKRGVRIKIAAIVFSEDSGSVLYTRKKSEAASRVGISYEAYSFSLTDDAQKIVNLVEDLGADPSTTGIIIQKPWRKSWLTAHQETAGKLERAEKNALFDTWWRQLTQAIPVAKDVDGLHPTLVPAIQNNMWKKEGRVLPATAQAVLHILDCAKADGVQLQLDPLKKICIIGKSDLLGFPLHAYFQAAGHDCELLGRKELATRMHTEKKLLDATTIISATGVAGLITGEMIQEGAVVIDVGEPQGDVSFDSVREKAGCITPVPGGVGPLTVVCLLESAVTLASRR